MTNGLIRKSEFRGRNPKPRTHTFSVLPETSRLKVRLWGAGGGGGSAEAIDIQERLAAGGGGGAGGYAETNILNPESSYEFFLAIGGAGGVNGDGHDAEQSWFSSTDLLFANGGEGGKKSHSTGPTPCVNGEGGVGGAGGGSLAEISGTGGAGNMGFGGLGAGVECATIMGGQGGTISSGSAPQILRSTICGSNYQCVFNGELGWEYGTGGGGARWFGLADIISHDDILLIGGNGAPAYLLLEEYRS